MGINRDRFTRKKEPEWVEWLSDDASSPQDAAAPVSKHQDSRQQALATPPLQVHQPSSRESTAHPSSVRRERLRQAGLGTSKPSNDVAPAVRGSAKQTTFALHITVPKLSWKWFRLPHYTRPSVAQVRYWGVFTVVVIGIGIGARGLVEWRTLGAGDIGAGNPAVQGAGTGKAPSFSPVFPSSRKEALAKTKHTYDSGRQLYSYQDSFEGAAITVSQQPLPTDIKKNPATLKDIAAKIGATEKVDTAFGSAYIATSPNKSSQRVVAVYRDLLLFVETVKAYDAETWKFYLESLR